MSRRAFSLIEMIVVMGILIVLMAILMPVVGNARDAANGTLCASHIKSLTQGFLMFAQDHDGHLPGTQWNTWSPNETDPERFDWLYGKWAWYAFQLSGGGNSNNWPPMSNLRQQLATAPQYGTLWKYINNGTYATTNLPGGGSFQTYLCPSLTVTIPGGGSGSNGRFDYAAFAVFDGASIKDIPQTSTMHAPYDSTSKTNAYAPSNDPRWQANFWSTNYAILPTPLVCQEDAQYNINSNLEGSHAGPDQMSHVHRGGSYYGSADGSVNWVNEPDLDLYQYWHEGANLWEAVPPSGGTPIQLNYDPGWWNNWANH